MIVYFITGSFMLIDGKDFTLKDKWETKSAPMGYDFWYQPRHNVMISSEWGAPHAFKKKFEMKDVKKGLYLLHNISSYNLILYIDYRF